MPSAVRPGPAHAAEAARSSASEATSAAATDSSMPVDTVPAVPSTSSGVPATRVRASAVPTTHGMPSWRAMMAVWLVGPPRSVTRARMTSGSSPAVSEGARSSATRTQGVFGIWTPGSGSPTTWATIRRSMSRRSVARSAIRPPIWVKIPTNWSTAAADRGDKVLAGVELLADGAAQSLVAGKSSTGREHLSRGAGRLVGLAAETVRDRAGRVVVRRQGGLGVCELSGAEALDGLGRDLSADQQGGPEGDAGDDGSALQNGGRNGFSGGGHDH